MVIAITDSPTPNAEAIFTAPSTNRSPPNTNPPNPPTIITVASHIFIFFSGFASSSLPY